MDAVLSLVIYYFPFNNVRLIYLLSFPQPFITFPFVPKSSNHNKKGVEVDNIDNIELLIVKKEVLLLTILIFEFSVFDAFHASFSK